MQAWLALYDKIGLSLLSDLDAPAASVVSKDNFVTLAYLSVSDLNKKNNFCYLFTCRPSYKYVMKFIKRKVFWYKLLPKLNNANQISS